MLIFNFVFDILNFLLRATYTHFEVMALFKKLIYLMLKIILFCGSAKKLFYHKFRHNHFGKFTDIFLALVKLIELLNASVVFKIF